MLGLLSEHRKTNSSGENNTEKMNIASFVDDSNDYHVRHHDPHNKNIKIGKIHGCTPIFPNIPTYLADELLFGLQPELSAASSV